MNQKNFFKTHNIDGKPSNRIKKIILTRLFLLALASSLLAPANSEAAVKLNKSSLTLYKGSTYKLKVKGTSKRISWKSDDKNTATVSKKGKIIARKVGKTTITAKVQKKLLRCKVMVKNKPVQPPKPIRTPIPAKPSTPTKTPTPTKPSTSITEQSAYEILNSLRSTYPEGMSLTNSYYYSSPLFGNGYGCYGFAAKLSDTVFGTKKAYTTHSSFEKVKVGDNIRIGNYHSVIVLTKGANDITCVEGNYNSSVHWDRKITSSTLSSEGFKVYTRY